MEFREPARYQQRTKQMLEREAKLASSDVMIPIALIHVTTTLHTGDLSSRPGCLNRSICHLQTLNMVLKRHQVQHTRARWAQPIHSKALAIPQCLECLECLQTYHIPSTPCLRYVPSQCSLLLIITDLQCQYPPQANQQRYPSSGSPMTNYGAPVPPAGSQQPAWQPGFASPAQLQQRGGTPTGPQGHMGIPYAFGQLPANINPHDPKSQHPIPGSYNRNHAFNPKTQSFVPGGGMAPVPPPQPPFTAPGSHHGSPQVGSPHLAYPGVYHQQPIPQPYGGGYGMARQGSSSSMPAYHSPRVAHVAPHVMPQNPQHMALPTHPHHLQAYNIPNRPNIPQGPSQPYSHLPTYGNPATLPQKPDTGI